ncbi:hypothetical protein GGU10DRAFT_389773 [Lentinula aff. detonsa]|uniref:Uncharacterized protein n=1 Tax=Lentinula aff. detonsa TaxID=2804958 RepID=A0AA38NK56_9AGAR|nr:hypothetical protein GGU10DRAFT_389773 [Lentinula aff. detonsa]
MMYPRSSPFFFLMFFGLYEFHIISARLYPTRPVSGTVYHCGKCDPITWMDDGKNPSMQNLGLLTVDLYCKDQYVFTIEQADPDAEMLMFCPPSPHDFQWPQGCNAYTLLFNGDNPSENQTIYTHDFRISGTSRAAKVEFMNHTIAGNPALRTALGVGSQTLTISPTTSVSQVPTSTTPASLTDERHRSDTSATTIYADPLTSTDRSHRNGASFTRSIDMEKLKFRFVFIVWPALIGISMAL